MKRILIIFSIFSVIAGSNAQNLKESDVPSEVKEKFRSMYPNISGTRWEMENGKYEAEFHENNVETSVLFEANGTYAQTEVEIPVSSLPSGVSDFAKNNLRNKKITEASKIILSDGSLKFEAEIGNIDYLFDSNGNLISKEIDINETEDDQ